MGGLDHFSTLVKILDFRGRRKWKISILKLYREFPDFLGGILNDRKSWGIPKIKCIKIKKKAQNTFFVYLSTFLVGILSEKQKVADFLKIFEKNP